MRLVKFFSSKCRWDDFSRAHAYASYHSRKFPAKLAMKYAIGRNCFLVLRSGGTMIEVSHERFNWLKNFVSSERASPEDL
jgi:hypothetical protein